jgi:hypothetical protein
MSDRPDISMTQDEILAFLVSQPRMVVTAVDDSTPVATVADVRLVDEELHVRLRSGDPVRNLLARDDRVCVLTDQFPNYYEIKGVAAHGRARFDRAGGPTFRLGLDDVVSFDFGKLPRSGAGSGRTDQ